MKINELSKGWLLGALLHTNKEIKSINIQLTSIKDVERIKRLKTFRDKLIQFKVKLVAELKTRRINKI